MILKAATLRTIRVVTPDVTGPNGSLQRRPAMVLSRSHALPRHARMLTMHVREVDPSYVAWAPIETAVEVEGAVVVALGLTIVVIKAMMAFQIK